MRQRYIAAMNKIERDIGSKNKECFLTQTKQIEGILNLEEDILISYYTIFQVKGCIEEKFYLMAVSILFKNINIIYSAYKLTKLGQYSAARILFRNVYESLIILKSISITKDEELINQWIDGREIKLNVQIFKKIKNPNSKPLRTFWDDLCKFCHGTLESNQYSVEFTYQQAQANFAIISLLLEMNFHVMNRYVASASDKSMVDRLIEEGETLKEKQATIREMLKTQKKAYSPTMKGIIVDFEKVWKFN